MNENTISLKLEENKEEKPNFYQNHNPQIKIFH